jgi:hypothetical protein
VSKYFAYVFWPEADERKEISDRIRKEKFFPKCVGFIDGTHLGLAFKPTKDGEEYFTRKQSYAVATLVSCDDMRRIRYLNVGWPGSVHSNIIHGASMQEVWWQSPINARTEVFQRCCFICMLSS